MKHYFVYQKSEFLLHSITFCNIIFDILCLTEDERNEAYWTVCELVKNTPEKKRECVRVASLDMRIAYERKRADEDIEMRKREFA